MVVHMSPGSPFSRHRPYRSDLHFITETVVHNLQQNWTMPARSAISPDTVALALALGR